MKKEKLLHVSSLIGLIIFILLIFGSEYEENTQDTSYSSDTYDSYSDQVTDKKENLQKQIAPIDEQKRIVKLFREKIPKIEKPAQQAIKNCQTCLQLFLQGKTTTSNVIQSAKYAKKKCEKANFALDDLQIPNNLPNDIENLLKEAEKNLEIAWGIRATTYNNLINYFSGGDPNSINYFNIDMRDAQNYTIMAVSNFTEVYEKLGVLNDLIEQESTYSKKTLSNDKNEYIGTYTGKEICSMGRNTNEWSNPYQIDIYIVDNECFLQGFYIQPGKLIEIILIGNEFKIPEQKFTDYIKIFGNGKKEGNKLFIDYTIIDMSSIGGDYIINKCKAEFEKN